MRRLVLFTTLLCFLTADLSIVGFGVGVGVAEARGRRWGWRPDLPTGWTWPPTKAMEREAATCYAELDRLGLSWRKGPRRRKIPAPVLIDDLDFGGLRLVPVFRPPPFVMDCRLAVVLARDAAPILRELGVKELRFTGIHNYRSMRGYKNRRRRRMLSRHAVGLAIDVRDVVTEDGAILSVKSDYGDGSGLLGEIERRLRATGRFRTILTPGNDPKGHDDHFHIEALAGRDSVIAVVPAEPAPPRSRARSVKGHGKKPTPHGRSVKR